MADQRFFEDLSAWFSASVGDESRHKWAAGRGKEGHSHEANFLFSDDSSFDDTLRYKLTGII
jgi:hypothetical protein